MKHLLSNGSIFLLLIALGSCGNGASNVPQAVKTTLNNQYPGASNVSWEKEDGNYEANWGGKSGEDTAVQYTPSGQFAEMELAIQTNALPQNALNYISSQSGKSVKEASKVTKANKEVNYEAVVNDTTLVFDENGNFIKKESGSD